jgi:hypothetical protein
MEDNSVVFVTASDGIYIFELKDIPFLLSGKGLRGKPEVRKALETGDYHEFDVLVPSMMEHRFYAHTKSTAPQHPGTSMRPPMAVECLFVWALPRDRRDDVIGDFREDYGRIRVEYNRAVAFIWAIIEFVRRTRPFTLKRIAAILGLLKLWRTLGP